MCSEIPVKTFVFIVPENSTVEEVLKNISQKQKAEYIALFDGTSQAENDKAITDYWSSEKIFYASTTTSPPTAEYIMRMKTQKEGPTTEISKSEPLNNTNSNPNVVPPPEIMPPQKYDINASVIQRDLYERPKVKPKAGVGNYIFYFNGSTKEHLMDGIKVELDSSMNPNTASEKLLEALKDEKVDMNGKQLNIYLAGGIPFIAGTLGDLYLNEKIGNVNRQIYGVITRPIPDSVLNKSIWEMCNVSDNFHKFIISPLCNSSIRGLSDMACLLGYLDNNGSKGDLLLRSFAATIHFPPLITSLYRIIENNQVVCRDVVTVCSTLFTYFRFNLPETISDDKVFEYALRLCNIISNITDIPVNIPMLKIEVKENDMITQFLRDLKLGPIVYFWKRDIGECFNFVDLEIQCFETIENAYKLISTFTPIAPLSMRVATSCSIVRGKDHQYLYLKPSLNKHYEEYNKVDIIDPMKGSSESFDIEAFAKEQGDPNSANSIDPNSVKQIIMINLGESKSMISDLDDNVNDNYRIATATQYITTFVNKNYNNKTPCIQGLVSFNDQITVKCPFSPFISDIEEKGLKSFKPKSTTKLWDSLLRSCEEIVKFRKDSNGNEIYKNALSRILVISYGEDTSSEAKVEDVVKELIKNKIIVDSIIISSEDKCKMLCAVCHATGGLSFRPESASKGLSIIEQDAFFNIEVRKISNEPLIADDRSTTHLKLTRKYDIIDAEFMNKVKDNSNFDTVVLNKEIIRATLNTNLATPLHICAKNVNSIIPNPRNRRILRELHLAALTSDPDSYCYDPDMKIYLFQMNLEKWKVFIKGLENSPYENKWWYLYVTFPELYPAQPPEFRFISVPYHLNVSSDGRICLNKFEKEYMPSKHVVEIIQELKELFILVDIDSSVKMETYDIYHTSIQYKKLARESAEKNAKDSIEDYIGSSKLVDDVPIGFKLYSDLEDCVQPYMISQISGKIIQRRNLVMASSGVYYDKNELKQLIAISKNPVCVVTGKLLTERLEDFDEL